MGPLSFLRRLFSNGSVDAPVGHLVSLCQALLAEPAEYAGAALARDTLAGYQQLDERNREDFFEVLARGFSPEPEAVGRAADAYRADPSAANLVALQRTVEPARQELFRRLNMAPGGTAALVEMRRVLLQGIKDHPQWRAIDADLLHLLRSWFNRGFLRLERIDWRTPAMVLEKIIQYEAVHAMQGWRDLRRRLEADRRCFAFFHPQLPDEPLIFIEVALTRGMSATVQPLLDPRAPVADTASADHAMFYSITNCQEGLRGISFGNLLIKQVAEELKRELPRLKHFATLSPIPGLRAWLEKQASMPFLDDPAWHLGEVAEDTRRTLKRLCAQYLLNAKQGDEPLDPVARFHLGNGASLDRINWMGDTSEQGIARSAGMMVNYVYRLEDVEENHDRYFRSHHVVASSAVQKLTREPGA